MTPKKMEALQMLNVAFASHDGAPVDQAIITKADFRLLFEALTEKPSAAPEEAGTGDSATKALDAICKMFGCKRWEYPGQVVRDAQMAAETLRDALAYIKHVGANHIMRGQPHPQQWLVDKIERLVGKCGPQK